MVGLYPISIFVTLLTHRICIKQGLISATQGWDSRWGHSSLFLFSVLVSLDLYSVYFSFPIGASPPYPPHSPEDLVSWFRSKVSLLVLLYLLYPFLVVPLHSLVTPHRSGDKSQPGTTHAHTLGSREGNSNQRTEYLTKR